MTNIKQNYSAHGTSWALEKKGTQASLMLILANGEKIIIEGKNTYERKLHNKIFNAIVEYILPVIDEKEQQNEQKE